MLDAEDIIKKIQSALKQDDLPFALQWVDALIDQISNAPNLNHVCASIINTIGNKFAEKGQLEKAIVQYQRVIDIKPDYSKAYSNLGLALSERGYHNEAVTHLQKAIDLFHHFPEAYNNLGIAYKALGNKTGALYCCQQALRLKPHFPEAYYNLGIVYEEGNKYKEALTCYLSAIHQRPNYVNAYKNVFWLLHQLCAWQEAKKIEHQAHHNKIQIPYDPFMSIALVSNPEQNLIDAKKASAGVHKKFAHQQIGFQFARPIPKKPLVVGYLSDRFRNAATAQQIQSLFGLHNRDFFQVHCYSYGVDDQSLYRQKIEKDVDLFRDIRRLNPVESATLINNDQVDILVDLMGHTKNNRLGISALKPAPIQMNYLGFPGSAGASFFDYILADPIVLPESHEKHYTEKPFLMPHAYYVTDHTQPIADKEYDRLEFNLPADGFVFCSFNNSYKIDPEIFSVWMNILKAVPKSVLWLLHHDKMTEHNLKKLAHDNHVQPDRLVFAQKLPKSLHLARQKLADICLDTRIYNGHTTTCDALWANVPVITTLGSHFASRVSASLLTAIGLPELITTTLQEYQNLAIQLSINQIKYKNLKNKLARNRLTTPLFDTSRFVKNLEAGYQKIWHNYIAQGEPSKIVIQDHAPLKL